MLLWDSGGRRKDLISELKQSADMNRCNNMLLESEREGKCYVLPLAFLWSVGRFGRTASLGGESDEGQLSVYRYQYTVQCIVCSCTVYNNSPVHCENLYTSKRDAVSSFNHFKEDKWRHHHDFELSQSVARKSSSNLLFFLLRASDFFS